MTDTLLLEHVVAPFASKLLDLTLGRFQVVQMDHRQVPEFVSMCRQEVETMLLALCKMDARALASERQEFKAKNSGNRSKTSGGPQGATTLDVPTSPRVTSADADGGQQSPREIHSEHRALNTSASSTKGSTVPLSDQHNQLLSKYDNLLSSEMFLRSTLSEVLELIKIRDVNYETLQGLLSKRQKEMGDQRHAYYREIRHLRDMIHQFRERGKCDLPDVVLYNWDDDSGGESSKLELEAKIATAVDEVKRAFETEKDVIEQRHTRSADELKSRIRTTEALISGLSQQNSSLQEEVAQLQQKLSDREKEEPSGDAGNRGDAPSQGSEATDNAAKLFVHASSQTLLCGDVSSPTSGSNRRSFPQTIAAQTDISMSLFQDEHDMSTASDALEGQIEVFRSCRPPPIITPNLFPSADFGQLPPPSQPTVTTPRNPTGKITPRRQTNADTGADPTNLTSPTASQASSKDGSKAAQAARERQKAPAKTASSGSRKGAGGQPIHGIAIGTTTSSLHHVSDSEDKEITTGWRTTTAAAVAPPAVSGDEGAAVARLAQATELHQAHVSLQTANETITQLRSENQRLRELTATPGAGASRPTSATVRSHGATTPTAPHNGEFALGGNAATSAGSRPTSANDAVAQLKKIRDELRHKNELLSQREGELVQLRLEMERFFSQYSATVPKNATARGINADLVEKLRDAVTMAEKQEEAYRVLSWKLVRNGLALRNSLGGQLAELHEARSRESAGTAARIARATDILQDHVRRTLSGIQEQRMHSRQAANVAWDHVLLLARGLASGEGDVVFPPTPRYYRQDVTSDMTEQHRPVEVFAAPGNALYFKAVSHAACAYSVEQVLSMYAQDGKTGLVTPRPQSAAAGSSGMNTATFPQRLRQDVAAAPPASNQWEAPSTTTHLRSRPQSAKPPSASGVRHMVQQGRTTPKPFFNPGGLHKLSKQEQRGEVVRALQAMTSVDVSQKQHEAHETYQLRHRCGSANPESDIFAGIRTVKLVGKNELH